MNYTTESTQRTLTAPMLDRAAARLGCSPEAIAAVALVESGSQAYIQSGRPAILFERHKFSKATRGKYDASNPEVSNRIAGGYVGGEAEYSRLQEAADLDWTAAHRSTSWGLFQVMGFNAQTVGFTDVKDMVQSITRDVEEHLRAFVGFIEANDLDDALAVDPPDFATFAAKYNGPAYAKNKYDTRMADAYANLCSVAGQIQLNLSRYGCDPGVIDGLWGPRTRNAVKEWCADTGFVHSDFGSRVAMGRAIHKSLETMEPSTPPSTEPVNEQHSVLGLCVASGVIADIALNGRGAGAGTVETVAMAGQLQDAVHHIRTIARERGIPEDEIFQRPPGRPIGKQGLSSDD